MKEFIQIVCWNFILTIPGIIQELLKAGFTGVRTFFNLCDLPYIAKPTQKYIDDLFKTLPNGMHNWNSPDCAKDMMKDMFIFCKKHNWLPVVCLGYQEELPHNWIGRAPAEDKYKWLGQFSQELGIYLRHNMGFDRVDMEVWNEPSKLLGYNFGWNHYCDMGKYMADGWKTAEAGKVYAYADDIFKNDYINGVLARADFMKMCDYFSTHIGVGKEDEEWDNGLIKQVTTKVRSLYPHMDHFITEMSVNGIWTRYNQIAFTNSLGQKVRMVSGYAPIGLVRALVNGELLGTRIDDAIQYKDDGWYKVSADYKLAFLAGFIEIYGLDRLKGDGDMVLKFDYKLGSKGMGVKMMQKICNKVLSLKLLIDGSWGPATNAAVSDLNKNFGFVINPEVIDEKRFNFYVDNYSDIWHQCEVSWGKGDR